VAHQPLADPEVARDFENEAADRKERLDFLVALDAIVDDYDKASGTFEIDAEMHHGERLRDQVVALLRFEGVRPPEDDSKETP